MSNPNNNSKSVSWRDHWYEVIFEADTPAGRAFDIALLVVILVSVIAVMLDSVDHIRAEHRKLLQGIEWVITILFTLEYIARIACSRRPMGYVLSFYGIIDLLAILPTYLMVLQPVLFHGTHQFAIVRSLRLLRAFRIFKLGHMLSEAKVLRQAVWQSRAKIAVFLSVVIIAVVIVGSMMHVIEGPENGFTSIPQSMYWAVVTMTTVGYGDIAPQTVLGKTVAGAMMILGYSLIIIPTGIVSAELANASNKPTTTRVCPDCFSEGHDSDAVFCKYCGSRLVS